MELVDFYISHNWGEPIHEILHPRKITPKFNRVNLVFGPDEFYAESEEITMIFVKGESAEKVIKRLRRTANRIEKLKAT